MKITNLLESSNPKYKGFYGVNYFGTIDDHGNLFRPEDQWPALCYAHGIYDIPPVSHENINGRDGWLRLLADQIEFLKINKKRTPNSVLEIGSGSGQISCTLSHMGYSIQSTDVNPHAGEFHQARAIDMYNNKIADNNYHLLLGDLNSVGSQLNLENIDTVFLIESIEHIYNDEWQNFLKLALPSFKKNHTHLIITNFQDMWPIGGMDGEEHCNTIDDAFFDHLASFANKVLFRDRAHLALEF